MEDKEKDNNTNEEIEEFPEFDTINEGYDPSNTKNEDEKNNNNE